MDYRHLGRSGLRVAPLCLGTMNFGPQTSEPDSFAIMDRALEAGVNFFDTADVYGGVDGGGVTETIVGRWFAQGGGRRDRVILATKVFGSMNPAGAQDPNRARGLSAWKIIKHCEESLRRLQTDYLDLYQMHHVDRTCPWDEIWTAFDVLIRQGKVRYVGSSNFAGWDIATAQQVAAQQHMVGLISEQSVYNLDNRTVELEVLPACRFYGLGLIPWSPLAGGLLGGVLKKIRDGRRANPRMAKRIAEKHDALKRYEALCRKLGESPATIGLAWLLHHPVVTAPIIGPRTLAQFDEALRVPEVSLDAATLRKLDAIFPGPGGEAPWAYAW